MKSKQSGKSSGKNSKSKISKGKRVMIGAWRMNEVHVSYIYNEMLNNLP